MKRLLSIISVVVCLALCLTMFGCNTAQPDQLGTDRSTIALDEMASYINGDGVLANISSNDASNTETVIVTVQSDNGLFPAYVLGKIVTGKGGLTGPGANGNTGGNNNNGGTTTGSDVKGIDYLVGRTVSCNAMEPVVGTAYDLYYEDESGQQVQANIENLPGLKDGDTVTVGTYTFAYDASSDKWKCTEAVKQEGKYFSTDKWTPIHLVSADLVGKASEGCQWLQWVTLDPTDGKLGFLGVDVGGLYKTTDAGKTWTPCTVGHGVLGSSCIVIDPKNKNHVLSVGCSRNLGISTNGIYMSMDAGETWELMEHFDINGGRTYRNQIIFDPTSYDESKKMCTTIYWSSDDVHESTTTQSALYKSTDGGKTWEVINDKFGHCHLEISSDGKVIYAYKEEVDLDKHDVQNSTLYRSTDGGKSFSECKGVSNVRTIDVIQSKTDTVYVGCSDGFYVSNDKGASFTKTSTKGWKANAQYLGVAEDGLTMSVQSRVNSQGDTYYSKDGGKSWAKSEMNLSETAFMPINIRTQPRAYDAKNPDRCVAIAGDSVMGSDDGGETWVTSNYGYTAICTSEISFNVNDNNLVLVPSQDYNGCFSIDGGKTWTYINWSGKGWGGMTYGGYILDEQTMIIICTSSWASQSSEFPVYTTHDGGKTINRDAKYTIPEDASKRGFGAVGNNDIAFIGNLRTTDKGKTFKVMDTVYDAYGDKVNGGECYGVYCADYETGRLYGADNQGYIVYSDDDGETWHEICMYGSGVGMPGGISADKDGNIYFVHGGACYKTSVDKAGKRATSFRTGGGYSLSGDLINHAQDIQVDYYNPEILYVGHHIYSNSEKIATERSMDGGKTWTTLNKLADGSGNPITEMDGGKAVCNILLNYKTNSLWCVGSCRGIASIPRVSGE